MSGMGAMGAIVETGTLAKVIVYSLVSGIGISVLFGTGIASAGSLVDALREHRTAAGVAWGAVTAACLLIVVAVIVLAIVIMSSK
jgi:hypothetical protein